MIKKGLCVTRCLKSRCLIPDRHHSPRLLLLKHSGPVADAVNSSMSSSNSILCVVSQVSSMSTSSSSVSHQSAGVQSETSSSSGEIKSVNINLVVHATGSGQPIRGKANLASSQLEPSQDLWAQFWVVSCRQHIWDRFFLCVLLLQNRWLPWASDFAIGDMSGNKT